MRLVGGLSTFEGRVEIYYSSRWGTVCGDGWGNQESMVVCRQLGYKGFTETIDKASFGPGAGLIWLEDVRCTGMEKSLSFCSYRVWSNGCDHAGDVGVRCQAGITVSCYLKTHIVHISPVSILSIITMCFLILYCGGQKTIMCTYQNCEFFLYDSIDLQFQNTTYVEFV